MLSIKNSIILQMLSATKQTRLFPRLSHKKLHRVFHTKGIHKKTFNRTCSRLQFTVFEFIWIQYICKFCLVYHLIDLDASKQNYSSFSETYVFFKPANSVEKLLLNFRNASVSHCFGNSLLTIIWNNLGPSNNRRMKRNLEFRIKKHILRNIFL